MPAQCDSPCHRRIKYVIESHLEKARNYGMEVYYQLMIIIAIW